MVIQGQMETKLTEGLEPRYLDIVNESHKHNVAPGSESHFKVTMVSDHFDGKNKVARHRMVNKLLADELAGSVHALSLQLMTAAEWEAKGGKNTHLTPPCASKKGAL